MSVIVAPKRQTGRPPWSASSLATLLAARPLAKIALILAALLPALAFPAQAAPLANACSKSKTYAPQTLDLTQPLNLGQLKNQLYFYACSGAYDSDLNKVLAGARAYVAARAAHVHQAGHRARHRRDFAVEPAGRTGRRLRLSEQHSLHCPT